jgi:hypothetical protein
MLYPWFFLMCDEFVNSDRLPAMSIDLNLGQGGNDTKDFLGSNCERRAFANVMSV